MKFFQKNILWLSITVFFSSQLFYGQGRNALGIVKSIADRVIGECQFEFELVKQEPVLGVQIIDFNREFESNVKGSLYALSYIQSDDNSVVKFGISSSKNISVRVNEKPVNFNKTDTPHVKEIAYGMINFFDTVNVSLNKGYNKILIKAESIASSSKIFIREITDDPESARSLTFSSKISKEEAWQLCGPFTNPDEESPEKAIEGFYQNDGKYLNWFFPKENLLPELIIGKDNIFKRDSYADWNYANGEAVLSILYLAEASGDKKYYNFVKNWCDFILNNVDYFRFQYDSLNALRGNFHRIFRKSMLDDAGAPVLPFAGLSLQEKNKNYLGILNTMIDYVSNKQPRLDDGTFCRPEPEKMTVWADDLFMSVPLLLRMGKITGDNKYFDDAAKQIKNFTRLLFDKNKNLYKHGWFSRTNKKSIAFWGRANGWVMWAVSEALLYLPKDHPAYSEIMEIYKNHINGLLDYRDEDGMWHQVLDHPESYEESSCTAMFILGLARGVNNGWLDKSYKKFAVKSWNALTKKIDNGIVHGICRGTGMRNDLEFYFKRPTVDNDPRGLGAVLTAGIEISKLQSE
jgi:unsaturated rhamnogalacturonyl hydrolase